MSPALDSDAVRNHLQKVLPIAWGARVDERMKTLGLNNAQVAALSGTTAQTVSKVRRGELVPRDYLRVMLASALCTNPDQLFPMPSMLEIASAA